MVFHQSFERTSRAVELYAKGWTNMVRFEERTALTRRVTHKQEKLLKKREADYSMTGRQRGERKVREGEG